MFSLRNLALAILITLPFTKSATLPVGFSLKIYELLIPVAVAVAFREGRLDLGPTSRLFRVWIVFFFVSLFPTAWGTNLILEANNTALEWAVGRYRPVVNALFHTTYLALNLAGLAVFAVALQRRALTLNEFARGWTWGALIAVGYAAIANVAYHAGLPHAAVLRFSEPQFATVSGIQVVRSGPFEEGNYFGLYLVLSLVMALWGGSRTRSVFYYWSLPVLALGVFVSASPAALVFMMLLVVVSIFQRQTPSVVRWVQVVVIVVVLGGILRTNLLEELVLDKFSLILFGGITDSGNISLMQRINESYHAWRIFLDHPAGVGIGNFGYFWGDHPEFFTELEVPYNSIKQIPNMVFAEILSEQGIQGFLIFLYSIAVLTAPLLLTRQWLLALGLAIMLAYFLVFPTFRLVFLWAFWAFLANAPRSTARAVR